ncbi:MAG: HAMP domain-containing protein, partial [Bradyrhizobiaceae bacterium]|nr:HAMP domain-containing protein [Bradyrhizobiaceae bacterium]
TDSVNTMGRNLTAQVRNIAEVTTAVAGGELSRKITVDVKGEILELKNTINTMVDQLNGFASEVTRVAREVGAEGKLGGQAAVPGVAGVWKDLTDNVNFMASNLTEQVRGIAKVVTAVADGNLGQRFTMQAKGEVAALADTINDMTDTLGTFAEQVTNVAREVGVEGRLGGQANVPGAAGTWKDLTSNVNLLAANLTSQVRAIAEVATAVTQGDLTRSIQVEARGEVAELKDNINAMISNLRDTTERNREQDWLKTNLARFAGILQGQRELGTVGEMLLSELSVLVRAHHGAIYHLSGIEGDRDLRLLSTHAHSGRPVTTIRLGEGLVGQCAVEKRRILLNDVAPGLDAGGGIEGGPPVSIVVLPVLFEGETKAVIELATVHRFTEVNLAFLDQLTVSIGAVFNTIEATMRTEGLLEQSQRLTVQLQSRQNELQQTNEELATKARLLAEQNAERERSEEHIRLLLNEVDHRSKNLLSVVQAIARQTLIASPDEFVTRFSERMQTLAASHDLLVKSRWQGIEIFDLVQAQLAHFSDLIGARIRLDGPSLRLSVAAAQTLGMIIHELATNAAKYGALSTNLGHVELWWHAQQGGDGAFTVSWSEHGGPAVVARGHRGFGSTVVKTMAESSFDGEVDLDFAATGLRWRLACPSSKVLDEYALRADNMSSRFLHDQTTNAKALQS